MFLIILCFISINIINAEEDSGETRFIDLLPEKEKKEFIESVARRIIDEVGSINIDQNITSADIDDAQLDKHSEYVKKLLDEEVKNLQRKSESRKSDNDGNVNNKDGKEEKEEKDTHIVGDRAHNVDLTLRNRLSTPEPHLETTNKVTKHNNKNAENISIDIVILKDNGDGTLDLKPDEVSVKVIYDELTTQIPIKRVNDKLNASPNVFLQIEKPKIDKNKTAELSVSHNVSKTEKLVNEKDTASDKNKDKVVEKHAMDEMLNVRAQTGLEDWLNAEAPKNDEDQSSSRSGTPDTKITYIAPKPKVSNDKSKNNTRRLLRLGTWFKPSATDLNEKEMTLNLSEEPKIKSKVIPILNSVKNETVDVNISKESELINDKTDDNNEKDSTVETATLRTEETSYVYEKSVNTDINSVQSKLEGKNQPEKDFIKSRRLLSSDDDTENAKGKYSFSDTIKYEDKPALRTVDEGNEEDTEIQENNATVTQVETVSPLIKDVEGVNDTLDTTTSEPETSTIDAKTSIDDVITKILSTKSLEIDTEVTTTDVDTTASYTETSTANSEEINQTETTFIPTTSEPTFETVRITSKHIESLETRETITTETPVVTETQFFNWKDYNESTENPEREEKLIEAEDKFESLQLDNVTEKTNVDTEVKLNDTKNNSYALRVASVTEDTKEFRTKFINFNDTISDQRDKESIFEDNKKITEKPELEETTKTIIVSDKSNDNNNKEAILKEAKTAKEKSVESKDNINFYEKFRGKKDESVFEDNVEVTDNKPKDNEHKDLTVKRVRDDKDLFQSLSKGSDDVTTVAPPILTTPTPEELTKNSQNRNVDPKDLSKENVRIKVGNPKANIEIDPNNINKNILRVKDTRPKANIEIATNDVNKNILRIKDTRPKANIESETKDHNENILRIKDTRPKANRVELKPADRSGRYDVYELLPGEDPFKKLSEFNAKPNLKLKANFVKAPLKLKMKKIEPDFVKSPIFQQINQPNYAQVYNYGPDNAYFNPQNKYGPNPYFKSVEKESEIENESEFDLTDLMEPSPKFRAERKPDQRSKKMIINNRVKPIDLDYFFGSIGKDLLRKQHSSSDDDDEEFVVFPESDDEEHPRNAMFYKVPPRTQTDQAEKILHSLQYYGYKHLMPATTQRPKDSTESESDSVEKQDTAPLHANKHKHHDKPPLVSELEEELVVSTNTSVKSSMEEEGEEKKEENKESEKSDENKSTATEATDKAEEEKAPEAPGDEDDKSKAVNKFIRSNLGSLFQINLGREIENRNKKRQQLKETRYLVKKRPPLLVLTGENEDDEVISQLIQEKRRPPPVFDEDYFFIHNGPKNPPKPKFEWIQRSEEQSNGRNGYLSDENLNQLNLKAIKDLLDNSNTRLHPELKKMSKLYLPNGRMSSEFDNYVTVLKDMFETDSTALKQYDWLRTTIEIRSALKKMRNMITHIKHGEIIPTNDLQLLKYSLYLYRDAKEDLKASRRFYSDKIVHTPIVERPWRSTEGMEPQINEYMMFLDAFEDALDDLHNAIKHIAMVTKYKSQRWYFNLKELYFRNPTRKQYLEILLHLSTSRLLDIIHDARTKGLNDNYVKYAFNHDTDVANAKSEFGLIVRLVDELNRI